MAVRPSSVKFTPAAILLFTAITTCYSTTISSFTPSTRRLLQSNNKCNPAARCLEKLERNEQCDIFPVPQRFVLSQPAPGSFFLDKLRDGVWVYNDGAFQSLILFSGTRLVVVDVPDTPASSKPDGSMTRVTDAVDQVLNRIAPNRIDLVYSHNHYDHIGGGRRMYIYVKKRFPSASIFIWGTKEAKRLINLSTSKRALPPNVIIGKKGRTLSLSEGLEIQIRVINGHTSGDLLLYIPRHKKQPSILMAVDLVFPGFAPFLNMGVTDDLGNYIVAHKEVLKEDFDIFVPGHFRIGNRNDVVRNLLFTKDLVEAGAAALRMVTQQKLIEAGIGNFTDPSSIAFANPWFAFIGVTRRLQIDACFRIMVKKWGCRIAGLDFTLRSHCFTAIQYNAFDL